MTARWPAFVVLLLCFLFPAVSGQPRAEPANVPPDDVLAAFEQLIGHARERTYLGLPRNRTWRVNVSLNVQIWSTWHAEGAPRIASLVEGLARATGVDIQIRTLAETSQLDEASYRNTVFVSVQSHLDILRNAADLRINTAVRELFQEGHWPFVFEFPRNPWLNGSVYIADHVGLKVVDTSVIRALVWALGGVSFDQELDDLIVPAESGPVLTPLGAAVFALMYHPDMPSGLPLAEAHARALQILGRAG